LEAHGGCSDVLQEKELSMSDEMKSSLASDASPTVALFQKTHASLVTLQRVDEQIAVLAEKRRKIQAELREVQSQLNEEIDRAASMPEEASIKMSSANSAQRRARLGGDQAIAEAA